MKRGLAWLAAALVAGTGILLLRPELMTVHIPQPENSYTDVVLAVSVREDEAVREEMARKLVSTCRLLVNAGVVEDTFTTVDDGVFAFRLRPGLDESDRRELKGGSGTPASSTCWPTSDCWRRSPRRRPAPDRDPVRPPARPGSTAGSRNAIVGRVAVGSPGARVPPISMSRVAEHVDTSPEAAESTAGAARFGARAVLGLTALLIGAVPFLLLVLLVQEEWSPLASLDGEVAAGLNAVVSDSSTLVRVLQVVTDLGGSAVAILVFTLTTVFLLIRGQRRLAAFTVATGVGLAVMVPVTKALIGRARPVVENPVNALPSNASFPSGHAMVSIVTFGMLALLALPAVRRRARPWVVAAALLVALVVGFTRLALGVHFVTDVLAGWALGVSLLAVMTAAFRGWQHDHRARPDESLDPLDVDPHAGPHLAPSGQSALPRGRTTVIRLLGVAAALAAALIVLGLLVTAVLGDSIIGRFDRSAVQAVAGLRSPTLTDVATTVGMLSGTPMVIAVSLTLAVVALAVTASRRPVVFVAAAVLGEVALYFVVSRTVDRGRPAVADLTADLPTAASWPSGHVAAAVAIYGALAALVVTLARSRWRWAVLAVPVLVAPAVGLSRIYTAAHYPTDVLAGLVLGTVWVLACARHLLPGVADQVRYPRPAAPARRVRPRADRHHAVRGRAGRPVAHDRIVTPSTSRRA